MEANKNDLRAEELWNLSALLACLPAFRLVKMEAGPQQLQLLAMVRVRGNPVELEILRDIGKNTGTVRWHWALGRGLDMPDDLDGYRKVERAGIFFEQAAMLRDVHQYLQLGAL